MPRKYTVTSDKSDAKFVTTSNQEAWEVARDVTLEAVGIGAKVTTTITSQDNKVLGQLSSDPSNPRYPFDKLTNR